MGKGLMCAVRHGLPVRCLAVVALVLLLPLLAGCSQDESSRDAASQLLFSPDPTQQAEDPAPTGQTSPTLTPLPDDCQAVVPSADVVAVVGAPLPGQTTYVFADPLPDIGRTGRVTCGYGDAGDGPKVEITLNEYETEQAAQDRVDVTLEAAAERGNEVREQPVGPYPGWIIGDPEDVSLVVDAGTRTLVVTIRRGVVTGSAEAVVLEQLAARALGLPTGAVEPAAP